MLKIHLLYRERKHQNKSKDQVLQPNGSSASRMEESNKLQRRLLFSGMSRIRLLVPKLKCSASWTFYLIAPCFLERQGRDNLFSKELARLARPVYFAGDTLSEYMQQVLALFGFSEWKRIPEDEVEGYQTQIGLQSDTEAL